MLQVQEKPEIVPEENLPAVFATDYLHKSIFDNVFKAVNSCFLNSTSEQGGDKGGGYGGGGYYGGKGELHNLVSRKNVLDSFFMFFLCEKVSSLLGFAQAVTVVAGAPWRLEIAKIALFFFVWRKISNAHHRGHFEHQVLWERWRWRWLLLPGHHGLHH